MALPDPLELEGLERPDHLFEMREADADLVTQRKSPRRAHFFGDGKRQVVAALFVDLDDPAQEREPRLPAGEAEGRKRALGRGDRLVDVGFRAHGDLGERVLVRRIDDVQEFRLNRRNPGAVDVKL